MRSMMLVVSMLTLLLAAAARGSRLTPKSLNNAWKPTYNENVATPTSANCREDYFKQALDHFSDNDTRTFKQRFFWNASYFRTGGPVLYYTGNEADVTLYVNQTGLMWENAASLGALLVFGEHRFYGLTLPFGPVEKNSPQELQYLSLEQSLADHVALVTHVKSVVFPNAKDSKVVAIGGSYGGMQSSWVRMRYPDVFAGAIAGSAPILAFDGVEKGQSAKQAGPRSYWKIVTDDATEAFGSAKRCSDNVRGAWKALDTMFDQGQNGQRQIRDLLRLCSPPRSFSDLFAIKLFLQMAWDSMAMGNFPFPSSYLAFGVAELPAFPFRRACDFLADEFEEGEDDEALIRALGLATSIFNNATKSVDCFVPPADSEYDGVWDYLWCTETLCQETYFGRNGRDDMFWPFEYSEASIDAHCRRKYNVTPSYDKIAREFGGLEGVRSSSNIVFSNGRFDPWRSGGVTSVNDSARSLWSIIIPNGAHHVDLMFSTRNDTEDIRRARTFEISKIRDWVGLSIDVRVGDRCTVGDRGAGVVRYVGKTKFAGGIWVGVELDLPKGKNDGSVKDQGKGHIETPSNPVRRLVEHLSATWKSETSGRMERASKMYCEHYVVDHRGGSTYICAACKKKVEDTLRIVEEETLRKKIEEEDLARRRARAPTDPPLSLGLGVTIEFLQAWTDAHDCWNWPTWKVVRDIVRPFTLARNRCRYAEIPELREAGIVGRASTFVSHTWGAKWGDLVAAIGDRADPQRKCWIDIFAVRQHPGNGGDLNFRRVIQECSSFVLVIPSIPKVAQMMFSDIRAKRTDKLDSEVRKTIPFLRIWCLVEIQAARLSEERVVVVVKGGNAVKTDRRNAREGLENGSTRRSHIFKSDVAMLKNMSRLIDVRNAEATLPEDIEREMRHVRESPGGVDALNQMIARVVLGAVACAQFPSLQSAACGDECGLVALRGFDRTKKELAFRSCAYAGYLAIVRLLLRGCVSEGERVRMVNSTSNTSAMTALHYAAMQGRESVVELLIENGAIVSKKNNDGQNAYSLALRNSHGKIARRLHHLQAREEVSASASFSARELVAAMLDAIRAGHVEATEVYIRSGADVTVTDRRGLSAYDHVVRCWSAQDAEGFERTWLDAWKKRIRKSSIQRLTNVLAWASQRGHAKLVRLLLARGVSPKTPFSATKKNYAILPLADKNHSCTSTTNRPVHKKYRTTALATASLCGHESTVDVLLNAGSDPNRRVTTDFNAVLLAASHGHVGVLRLLVAHGGDPQTYGGQKMRSALGCAVVYGDLSCVQFLAPLSKRAQVVSYLKGLGLLLCQRASVAKFRALLGELKSNASFEDLSSKERVVIEGATKRSLSQLLDSAKRCTSEARSREIAKKIQAARTYLGALAETAPPRVPFTQSSATPIEESG
eukprot:g1488.t1